LRTKIRWALQISDPQQNEVDSTDKMRFDIDPRFQGLKNLPCIIYEGIRKHRVKEWKSDAERKVRRKPAKCKRVREERRWLVERGERGAGCSKDF
jgi:hypothetical protein